MTAYCTESDVYRFVPPGLLAQPGRPVASVIAASGTFILDQHGLALNAAVAFRADPSGSLPTGLTAEVTYYAIPVTSNSFRVATAPGGAAVTFSTTGEDVIAITSLPWAEWIAECSAMLDQTLPAHVVPALNPDGSVPEPVKVYTACLLAIRALAHTGRETAAVQAQLEYWQRQADRWARGVPLRGAVVPASSNCAITRSGARVDPRGWDAPGGRIP
jgi:hypothetical protein